MSADLDAPLTIGGWFQGPTGQGQGGWTAAKVAERIAEPITVGLRAPIPLDVEMTIVETDAGWECRHGGSMILDINRWVPDTVVTPPVSVEEAEAARHRFLFGPADHPVPYCFSCGLQHDGMRVHAGPLGEAEGRDGEERFATDWTAPAWADGGDGVVDPAALWAALDCTSAFYVCCHPTIRAAYTASYAVEVFRPVEVGETLALVGFRGDGEPDWDGRKRVGASAAFDSRGLTVARTRSFWVALS